MLGRHSWCEDAGVRGRALALVATVASIVCAAAPATASALPERLGEVGASGSGAGQLGQANGVAFDSSGNVFIADRSNHRVTAFTPEGVFLRAFGRDVVAANAEMGFEVCDPGETCQSGAFPLDGSAGELSNPGGIAIDSSNRVFVIDLENRVSEFTTAGTFVRAFGWGVDTGIAAFEVCTDASGCQSGAAGGGAGQLGGAEDVAIDSAGRLIIADSSNARLSVFEVEGAPSFVHAMGLNVDTGGPGGFEVCTASCQTGLTGGSAGALDFPIGIGLAANGDVYVAENVNDRVSVIGGPGTAPVFLRAFGPNVDTGGPGGFEVCTTSCQAGTGDGAFGSLNQATDVVVAGGLVSVVDRANHRISQFTEAGPSPVRAFGENVIPGGPTGFEICDAGTGCQAGSGSGAPGAVGFANRVTVDCRGSLWVSDSFGRVQRFGEPATALPPCPLAPTPPSPTGTCRGRTATHVGGPGADVITGTKGPDVVVTAGGNDRINTGPGADVVCAGAGNDTVKLGGGDDTAYGEAGTDRLFGGSGRDALFGQSGRDRLVGGGGRGDRCVGGGGKDSRKAPGCELRRKIP